MFPSLREEKIVVPPSGCDYVPTGYSPLNIAEPGGKCVHGVYIPSNQEDQNYAESCHICMSLVSFCKTTGRSFTQANVRVDISMNYEHEDAIEILKELEANGRFENSDQPNTDQ